MRRLLVALGGLVAAGAVAATVAIAASGPARNAGFRGSGADYLNKGKTWTRGATGRFSFRTNADGTELQDFKGTYTYSCGGSATITAKFVTISANGRFDYPFTQRFKTGKFWAEIYGQFFPRGRKASVNYLIDFVTKGKRVRHPYDTRDPQSLGCASWVQGVAKTS
jgi:hypothetical protein